MATTTTNQPKQVEDERKKQEDKERLEREKGERAYRLMLLSIIILAALGLVAAALYGSLYSFKGAIIALLASSLGYAFGGISGFLFGFPRYTDNAPIASAEDLRAVSSTGSGATGLRHNTNLERITDWLMTMIIGATLVNLQELVQWAEAHFRSITAAIVYSAQNDFPDPTDVYATPGAVLVMPFMAAGFLHMYMWARKYLLPEWLALDKALRTVATLREAQKDQQTSIKRLEASQYSVDPTFLTRELQTFERLGVDEDTIGEIEERYNKAETWDDDPFIDFGPSEANGFRLNANVVKDAANKTNPYQVSITVERVDGMPFRGLVSLLLHNSYRAPIITDPLFDGPQYKQTIPSSASFWLGVVVVQEAEVLSTTRLGLDLSKLPNLPEGF